MASHIRIATRKSPLAMEQARQVEAWLRERLDGFTFELLPLRTRVDERLSWSLEKRGGIGLFTKELEDALLDGRANLAVHSAKDLPTRLPEDLRIAGYLPRARANDILVRRTGVESPGRIATSSPRRRAQLKERFPEAAWTSIRGNVGTRLRKIAEDSAETEASVLAAAGLDRLQIHAFDGLTFELLATEAMVPAPGQAAIAVQCRETEPAANRVAECLDEATFLAVSLERSFLRRLGGGCQTPVGAYAEGDRLHIYHPETGYRSLALSLSGPDEIESTLDIVFKNDPFHRLLP